MAGKPGATQARNQPSGTPLLAERISRMARKRAIKALVPAAFLAALAASGCAIAPAGDPTGPCPVASAGGWRAWVDLMPGPDRPKLWVVGKVSAPTGGWTFALERGPIQESYPAVQQVILRAVPPAGPATQAFVTHELQESFPYPQEIGAVTVRCGSEVLAAIPRVERAH